MFCGTPFSAPSSEGQTQVEAKGRGRKRGVTERERRTGYARHHVMKGGMLENKTGGEGLRNWQAVENNTSIPISCSATTNVNT